MLLKPLSEYFLLSPALVNFFIGVGAWRVWVAWGWMEILALYRRTTMGPFLIVINQVINIGVLGLLMGYVLKQDLADYLIFYASGFIIWFLISSLIESSIRVYTTAHEFLRESTFPYSQYILKEIIRFFIIFGHSMIVFLCFYVLLVGWPSWVIISLVPALLLYGISALFLGVILGTLVLRYRDLEHILLQMVRLGYFVTPVFWKTEMLDDWAYLVNFNPAYHYLEIIRQPLLGQIPDAIHSLAVLALTGILVIIGCFMHHRLSYRLPFWA